MPGVGVGVLLFSEEKKVLLILRNSDKDKAKSDMRLEGTYTLPAGKVKKGETIFEAAKRKVKEEANLEIDDLEVISIADDINSYAHFVTIGIIAKKYKGNVSLGNTEEHVSFDFFSLDNLPGNICLPSLKIIENYRNNIIYKEDK